MRNKKIFAIVFLMMAAISGCQKEEDPLTPDRDKFLGTWKVTSDGSESKHLTWEMSIKSGSSSGDQILIENFDLQGGTTTIASVSGSSFSISKQQIGSETVQGSGSYNNGTLSFHYTADDGQKIDDVTATASRK